eukprot:PhM_4_TR1389/c0_g1_i1/m.12760
MNHSFVSSHIFILLSLLLLIVGVVVQVASAADVVNNPLQSGYIRGRVVKHYLFDTPMTSTAFPTTHVSPSRMYVFRTSFTSTTDLQHPLFRENSTVTATYSDARQVVVVIVPSASVSSALPITSEGAIPTAWERVVTSTYRHVPLTYPNSSVVYSWGAQRSTTLYPTKPCYISEATTTILNAYLDLGTIEMSSLSKVNRIVQLVRATSKSVVEGNYILSAVTGDTEFSPFFVVETLTVPESYVAGTYTTMQSVSSLLRVQDTRLRTLIVAEVQSLATLDAANFTRHLGWYQNHRVEYYDFNTSRVSTAVGRENGTSAMQCFVFRVGGTTLASPVSNTAQLTVREHGAAHALFSDLCHLVVVVVPSANASTVFTSSDQIPESWKRIPQGQYQVCPVVNESSTLTNAQDAAAFPKVKMYAAGETVTCFDFGLQTDCRTNKAYQLVRSGETTAVPTNDIFVSIPTDRLTYSNFVWLRSYAVKSSYVTNTITTSAELPSNVDQIETSAVFALRPIVSVAAAISSSYRALPTPHHTLVLSSSTGGAVTFRYALNASATAMEIDLSVDQLVGYMAFSVSSSLSAVAHRDKTMIVAYLDKNDNSCVRTMAQSSATLTSTSYSPQDPPSESSAVPSAVTSSALLTRWRNGTVSLRIQLPIDQQLFNGSKLARISFAVRRSGVLSDCSVAPASMAHGPSQSGESGYKILNLASPSSTVSTPVPSVIPTNTLTPAPATPAPPSVTASPSGNTTTSGTYRFDHKFTLFWSLDIRLGQLSLTFALDDVSGWAAVGFGSNQMANADIILAFRDSTGAFVAHDYKSTGYSMPFLEASQDIVVTDSSRGIIRRALNTGDKRNSQSERKAYDKLVDTVFTRSTGWHNHKRVTFYAFPARTPSFGTETTTYNSVMYRFTTTSPLKAYQSDILDVMPGQGGYSELWQVVDIVMPSTFLGPVIKWAHQIPASWTRTTRAQMINCPVVNPASTLGNATDAVLYPRRGFFYRGDDAACFDFGNTSATAIRQMRTLRRKSNTNTIVQYVFGPEPTTASSQLVPTFCWNIDVFVNDSVVSNTVYTSLDDITTSDTHITIAPAGSHVSCPAVIELNETVTAAPSPTPAPTVPTSTPAPTTVSSRIYNSTQDLFNDGFGTRITLDWNFKIVSASRKVLEARVTLRGSPGYVAVGFANGTASDKMASSEIVAGFVVSSTGQGCVRQLTSHGATSATDYKITASAMPIRDVQLEHTTNYVAFSFERDISTEAYSYASLPLDGGTSRVIYAMSRHELSIACNADISTTIQALNHEAAPHGSTTVAWTAASSTSAPSTPTPTARPNTPTVLTATSFARQPAYYRSLPAHMYCVDNVTVSSTADSATVELPFVYAFEEGTRQSSLVGTVPGMNDYAAGLWTVVLIVNRTTSTELTSVASVLAAVTAKTAALSYTGRVLNCPIVHPDSKLADASDNEQTRRQSLYFSGQVLSCIDLGNTTQIYTTNKATNRVVLSPSTNVASAYVPQRASGASSYAWEDYLIDDAGSESNGFSFNRTISSLLTDFAPSLRRLEFVAVSASYTAGTTRDLGTIGTTAARTPTTTWMNCRVVQHSAGAPDTTQIGTLSYSLQTGFAAGRQVRFHLFKRTPSIANRFGVRTTSIVYVFRSKIISNWGDATSLWLNNDPTVGFVNQRNIVTAMPGEITYSDLHKIVVVTNTTAAVGATTGTYFTNATALRAALESSSPLWKVTETPYYINCPIVHNNAVLEGSASTQAPKETWLYNDTSVACFNFGFSTTIATKRLSQGFSHNRGVTIVYPSLIGSFGYSSIMSLVYTPESTTTYTSYAQLNFTSTTFALTHLFVNAPIVEVAQGANMDYNAANLPLSLRMWNKLGTTRLDATLLPNLNAVNLTSRRMTRGRIYVFRRGLTVDSDVVDFQSSIIDSSPTFSAYALKSGYAGYSDFRDVTVVKVPANYSIPSNNKQITSVNDLLNARALHFFAFNESTGVVQQVPVVTSNTTDVALKFVASSVWYNGVAVTVVDLGMKSLRYATEPTFATRAFLPVYPNGSAVGEIIPEHDVGSAEYTGQMAGIMLPVPENYISSTIRSFSDALARRAILSANVVASEFMSMPMISFSVAVAQSNTLQAQHYKVQSGWYNRKKVSFIVFNDSKLTSGNGNKYVFRRGSSYYSATIDGFPPLVDRSPDDDNYVDTFSIHVVTIPSTITTGISSLTSIDALYQQLIANCWPVTDTDLIENAPVVHAYSTLDAAVLSSPYVREEIVFSRGRRLKQFVLGVSTSVPSTRPRAIWLESSPTAPTTNSLWLFSNAFSGESYGSGFVTLTRQYGTKFSYRSVTEYDTAGASNGVLHTLSVTSNTNIFFYYIAEDDADAKEIATTKIARMDAWVDARKATLYQFNDSLSATPNIMYVFRGTASQCTLFGTSTYTNMYFLLTKLPGQTGYCDLKVFMCVLVPSAVNTYAVGPRSLTELETKIRDEGWRLHEVSGSTLVYNLPIVAAATTMADSADDASFPRVAAYYETNVVYMRNMGVVSVPLINTPGKIYHIFRNGAQLESNKLLDNVALSSPIKQIHNVVMPTTYVTDSILNATEILVSASSVSATNTYENIHIVSVTDPISPSEYDDYIITSDTTPMIWAYGPKTNFPVSFQQHTTRGSANINFFTGVSDSKPAPTPLLTEMNFVSFDYAVSLAWEVRRRTGLSPPSSAVTSSKARRHRHRQFQTQLSSPQSTYGPADLEVVFTLTVRTDEWAAIGITNSGGMRDADVMMAYHKKSPTTGIAKTYLKDMKVKTNYAVPSIDAQQDLTFVHVEASQPQGFIIRFSRPLRTGDADDFSIEDATQTIIWAHGPFIESSETPQKHTGQGVTTLNLVNRTVITIPRATMAAWPFLFTAGVVVIVVLCAVLVNLLPPGVLNWGMWVAPGGYLSELILGWLTTMVIGELVLFLVFLGLVAFWGAVAKNFYDTNGVEDPALVACGFTTAFVICFLLLPVCRNNLFSVVFRTSYHNLMKWHTIFAYMVLLLGTIHGAGMMANRSTLAFEWSGNTPGLAGFLSWLCLVVFMLSNAFARRFYQLWYFLHIVTFLLFFILVHLHVPSLVYGTLFSIILYVIDMCLRARDRSLRRGHIRSYQLITPDTIGIEVEVGAPLHTGVASNVHSRPGEFVMLRLVGSGEAHPFSLSSRSIARADYTANTFTLHIKATSSLARSTHRQRRTFTSKLVGDAAGLALKGRSVTVEGPYGGIRLQLRHYRTLLVVAGGIGITPVMSLLDHLTGDPMFTVGTSLQHVTIVWAVKTLDQFLVAADLLHHALTLATRPFNLQVHLHVTQPVPVATVPILIANRGDVAVAGDEMQEMRPEVPRPEEVAAAAHAMTHHPLFTLTKVVNGRPNIPYIIGRVHQDVANRTGEKVNREPRVGVFVSGPQELVTDVRACAYAQNKWRLLQFHVEAMEFNI